MNKKELIEAVNKESHDWVNRKSVISLIEQLDEQEIVKIPQFVADFISEQKKQGYTLSYSIDACMSDRVAEWYWDNSELFARAWLDGYEKEKRYLVRIIGITNYNSYLNYHKEEYKWTIESRVEIDAIRTEHTRKELEEAGFGWVFNCPGIEVLEVE